MSNVDLTKMDSAELERLAEQVSERRAALAVAKNQIENDEFDADSIRVGMSRADRDRAWSAVGKALKR